MELNSSYGIKKSKVSIIGSGYVGASTAYALMLKGIADEIVLVDLNKELSGAEAFDIRHGLSDMGYTKITNGDYSDISDSDLIIITAGRNRRPNETRLDMVSDNIKIAKSVSEEIKKYYTRGVILVVSNPVDIITYTMSKWLGLPNGIVLGTGCTLDSSRFVNVIADYFGLEPKVINAMVIGEHGESQVQLWSKVSIEGKPLEEYCKALNLEFTETQKRFIEQKIGSLGTEIIRGKGRTHYGIATCICHIANAILNKQKIIASVTSVLNGEYGIKDIAISLPCVISSNGIEKILTDKINDEEYLKLQNSALTINNVIQSMFQFV